MVELILPLHSLANPLDAAAFISMIYGGVFERALLMRRIVWIWIVFQLLGHRKDRCSMKGNPCYKYRNFFYQFAPFLVVIAFIKRNSFLFNWSTYKSQFALNQLFLSN